MNILCCGHLYHIQSNDLIRITREQDWSYLVRCKALDQLNTHMCYKYCYINKYDIWILKDTKGNDMFLNAMYQNNKLLAVPFQVLARQTYSISSSHTSFTYTYRMCYLPNYLKKLYHLAAWYIQHTRANSNRAHIYTIYQQVHIMVKLCS